MTQGNIPTALETPNCPPHHFLVDSKNIGTCCKCGLVEDFGKLQGKSSKSSLLEKATKGGKSRGRPRIRGKKIKANARRPNGG